ncbi:fluoride efflux transporter CrcB [Desulfocurvus sp. DL9XJH121]
MQKLLFVVLGGGCGALARYLVAGWAQRLAGSSFPFGTFTVNALGCLLFGFIWGLAENRAVLGPQARLLVLTGFMGAFTTFSTYAFESAGLLRAGQWAYALLNMVGQNVAGLVLVFAGLALARYAS